MGENQLQLPCWQSTTALNLNPESSSGLRWLPMSHRMPKQPISAQEGGTSETKAVHWSSGSRVECNGSAWMGLVWTHCEFAPGSGQSLVILMAKPKRP